QSVRTGDGLETVMRLAYPRNDQSVLKTNDQFHLHRHFAAQTFDDANDVGVLATRRHEIDQADCAALGFNFGFDDERVAAVAPPQLVDLLRRREKPMAVFLLADERGETGRRIEARKAKPVDT